MLHIIDELESELLDKKGLFSKRIDVDRCVQLVNMLQQTIPDDFAKAQQVLSKREQILTNADTIAQNTIREAEERASYIVDNSELIKQAQVEAKKKADMAKMHSDILIERTKTHLDNMFKDIEQFLLSNLSMIRNNREELRGAMIMVDDKQE